MIKSLFLAFLGVIISFSLSAQITIQQADMPQIGDSLYSSFPDSLTQVDLDQTGPNSNWDFRSLEAIVQQRDIFVAPSSTPFTLSFFFLGSNLVRLIPTPDSIAGFGLGEGFQYFKSSSSGFENMGFGGFLNGIPVPLANDPTDTVYTFPLAYGNDTTITSSLVELSIPGLVFIRQEQTRSTVVDGWGSIQTPYGTFDAIRVVSSLTGQDSISLDTIHVGLERPLSREYKWLAQGEGLPILQVNTSVLDSIGEVQTSISYRDSVRAVPLVGIEKPLPAKSLQLYPNPAQNQVSLSGSLPIGQPAELQLFSLDGQLIYSTNVRTGQSIIPLLHVPSGQYIVRLLTKEEQYRGKLLIRK
ncbi:MAG: T9SS type A sorting domain-containing protein [Bacteroidota bacterium]